MPLDEREGYQGYSWQELESWIPVYLNGSLEPGERLILESWLKDNPRALEVLRSWRQIQTAVKSRPVRDPGPWVWKDIARAIQAAPPRGASAAMSVLAGVGLALVSLMLLWVILRPGVVLRWSINEPAPVTYRVYRAPLNSDQYTLVTVLPARPGVRDYAYLDSLFVPGQPYTYRVEGLGQGNVPLFSRVIRGPTAGALPGQLSILFASVLVGLFAARIVQQRQFIPRTLQPS